MKPRGPHFVLLPEFKKSSARVRIPNTDRMVLSSAQYVAAIRTEFGPANMIVVLQRRREGSSAMNIPNPHGLVPGGRDHAISLRAETSGNDGPAVEEGFS